MIKAKAINKMIAGPCKLFTAVYLVNSFQNLHSGSLPLFRQIFENVTQTEGTNIFSHDTKALCAKEKKKNNETTSCFMFPLLNILCLHHVCCALCFGC